MGRIEKMNVPKRGKRSGALMNITRWKMDILDTLRKDDEISKLLFYDSEDALSRKTLTDDQQVDLVNSKLIGYRYVPEVVEKTGSYISIGISHFEPQESFRQFSDDYVMGYITFYILCDMAIMNTEDGYRNDLLAARVYDLFQESSEYGMGTLRLDTALELWTQNNKFGGYTLSFKVVDFK
ncbi:hypothetical protein ACWN8V_07260 [Vagococcus elongatus]|uniref:hypothetical protein n=1 Tax=Vagococcus elongatus TaxID=180344 RepID=UPI001FE34455|nr:hypothetical protein [Vagococcus elongatus]